MAELRFAWTVCKHVKSNAIVLTADRAAVGVGAGQMSRVDSVRIAVEKSNGRHTGAVLASDAFFPFADGPEAAIDAGVAAMVSPGRQRPRRGGRGRLRRRRRPDGVHRSAPLPALAAARGAVLPRGGVPG
jgi:hypothetical protein